VSVGLIELQELSDASWWWHFYPVVCCSLDGLYVLQQAPGVNELLTDVSCTLADDGMAAQEKHSI